MPLSRRRTPAPPARAGRGAAWQRLTRRLAEALELLEEGLFLVLSVRGRHRFVQFAGAGEDGLRAECVANQYLAVGDRLSAANHRALRKLGWRAPSRRAVGTGSVGDEDGSPNWLRVFPEPVDVDAAAELAVRTFTEVYGVEKVDALQYEAFEADGGRIYFHGLPVPREVEVEEEEGEAVDEPDDARRARVQRLEAALHYACDDDGVTQRSPLHWSLNVEGISLEVVLEEELPLARVIAPLFPAANLDGDVHELLNRVNAERLAFGYVYERDSQVRYAAEVVLEPFHPAQVVLALQMAARAARAILMDDELDALDDLGDEGPDPRDN